MAFKKPAFFAAAFASSRRRCEGGIGLGGASVAVADAGDGARAACAAPLCAPKPEGDREGAERAARAPAEASNARVESAPPNSGTAAGPALAREWNPPPSPPQSP